MASSVWRFTRNTTRPEFILSQNSPSTDAISALERWSERQKGRSYEIRIDENECLIAQLSCNEGDKEAGPDLDTECRNFGIERCLDEGN